VLESVRSAVAEATTDDKYAIDIGGGEERLWRFEHKQQSSRIHGGADVDRGLSTPLKQQEVISANDETGNPPRNVLKGGACWEQLRTLGVQPVPVETKVRYFVIHDSVRPLVLQRSATSIA
jgi:hypothetical protein